METEMK